MSHFFLLLTLSSSVINVEDNSTKKLEYQIDDRYKAGEYLIYDCQKQHFACVNKDGYSRCGMARTKSRESKQTQYDCAPLKIFQNKKSCVLTNYDVVERNAWKRFCFPK